MSRKLSDILRKTVANQTKRQKGIQKGIQNLKKRFNTPIPSQDTGNKQKR